jgi:hypothetical protein
MLKFELASFEIFAVALCIITREKYEECGK